MPLNRKWRSMDFFGSHENVNKISPSWSSKRERPFSSDHKPEHGHHLPIRNMFRHRLSSVGSKDDPPTPAGGVGRDREGGDPQDSSLMQKCVIIQKDEKGYGFTVSGDNPVFVASVKQDGAAARAGVQNGDRIVKVNGTLVTQRNHLDVVKLIKSGSYVALTLLGKSGTAPSMSSQQITASSNRDSLVGRVTAPQPVDPDKDRELWQQKVHMTRAMYETAKEDHEKLQKLYVSRPTDKLHTQLLEKERTVKALDNQLKQLTGWDDLSPLSPAGCDVSSMSDSASPSVSPTPDQYRSTQNSHDIIDDSINTTNSSSIQTQIIHIDDEEINSEDDQMNDPGVFADIKMLENKPAHMAVLLNYLISNSDPSAVLFHMITDLYSRSSASIKELRKWAYEIFSTFIYKLAPLSIAVEDNVISQIDSILAGSGTRTDNENILRNMFQASRQSVSNEISELLADFRSKRDLGMGNLFGIQKVQDNMDRVTEVRVAEELLMPHVKLFGSEDNNKGVVVDKDLATGWALATFLRSLAGPKSLHTATLDRVQTFMMKDKKSIKFPGSRSSRAKVVKGHQLNLQHFYVTAFCSFCGNLIWGVGYQGFVCQSCEMTLHKSCAEEITETCSGKKNKRNSSILSNVRHSRKPSSTAGVQQVSHGSSSSSSTEQTTHAAAAARSSTDSRTSYHTDTANSASTQPYPKQEESELATALSIIAGITPGHSVQSMVNRYHGLNSPTGAGPAGSVLTSDQGSTTGTSMSTNSTDRRGSSDLSRSGSLNNKEVKTERPARRAKSDVDVDSDMFRAINHSGSSSASSLSSRSIESPGTSTDNVSEMMRAQLDDPDLDVEAELPALKHVLTDDVLRKMKPKEKKRQEVLNELLYTERAHLRNLKVLDLLFHRPMLQDKGIIVELSRGLFPNITEMISFHVSIVRDMKERKQESPVIKDIGDILLKWFDGEAGERFSKGCAEYCRNQAFTLDALKKHTRKEPRLQQFLHDAESNMLCRRLQLKDLMPSQMQRLTKYPLLIDSLLKYTQHPSQEYTYLEKAQERCKYILAYVNQAVKECENYHKLKDIQKRLDRRSLEAFTDPALSDLKKLDLTQHKLIFDSPLTWKLRSHRTLDMHVLLFEEILVLLQKQDDKYLLKCQSTNVQPTRDDKYTHFPVLKLQNLLARTLATEKKSFFVVNISESRAQMYEFTAASSELRLRWCKLINEKADELKKTWKVPAPVSMDLHQTSQASEQSGIERNRFSRISRRHGRAGVGATVHVDVPAISQAAGISQADRTVDYEVAAEASRQLDVDVDSSSHSQLELIQPEEVHVSDIVSTQSTSVSASLLAATAAFSPGNDRETQPAYSVTTMQTQPAYSVTTVQQPDIHASFVDQVKQLSTRMNDTLVELAGVMSNEKEDKNLFRQELDSGQQKMYQQQQQQEAHQAVSEFNPYVAVSGSSYIPSSVARTGTTTTSSNTTRTTADLTTAVILQQESDILQEKYALEDLTSSVQSSSSSSLVTEAEQQSGMHVAAVGQLDDSSDLVSGMHEATVRQLDDSLELVSEPTPLLPVTATSHAGVGPDIADDDDDYDDHEISVADLPLPDLVIVPPTELEPSREADVEDSEADSDDNDGHYLKSNNQEVGGLSTTIEEDTDGEQREEEEAGGEQREEEAEKDVGGAGDAASFSNKDIIDNDVDVPSSRDADVKQRGGHGDTDL